MSQDKTDQILQNLNPAQYEGVITTEGPVLVLAGAGSGKTKVLTHRIAYLIKTKHINYENILAVTFTNKAAKEMKERIGKLLDIEMIGYHVYNILPFMGTFHSICVKILRSDGQNIAIDPNFTIYDTNDQQDIIKECLKDLNISPKEFNPNAILNAISSAKNELKLPDDFDKFAQGYFLQTAANVYHKYYEKLKTNNALDFDDLIMQTTILLKQNQNVLLKYQNLFQYILVDEYQDTNHAQYELVNILAGKHRNICVVGDPDQSIYSFRGADISNILSFEKDFPDTKIIKLEQNYRSTKNILDAAQNVIEKNKNRKDKKLISNKDEGVKITIYEALNENDEARFITNKIQQKLTNAYNKQSILNNIAVLYRTNAQSRSLEEQMLRASIPYVLVGGVRFYDRKEIKDILSYFRIIYNTSDDNSLKRIINIPTRGIGPKAYNDFVQIAKNNQISAISLLHTIGQMTDEEIDAIQSEDLELYKIANNKNIKSFAQIVAKIFTKSQELPPSELMNFILQQTSYIQYIDDHSAEAESRKENINELFSVAERYSALDPSIGLAEFMTDVALVEQESTKLADNSQGAVTLMTIHAAKGLEFDTVFIVGLEEGLFPHSRVFTAPDELEEERRLAYVAITRAKSDLYLIYASQRMIYGKISSNPASRFLADIPEYLTQFITANSNNYYKQSNNFSDFGKDFSDEMNHEDEYLEIGDRVHHMIFGEGEVMGGDTNIITVRFKNTGIKKLSKEFAKLKKI